MVFFTLHPEDLEASLWPLQLLLMATGLGPGRSLPGKVYKAVVAALVVVTTAKTWRFRIHSGKNLLSACHLAGLALRTCTTLAHLARGVDPSVASTLARVDNLLLERPRETYRRNTLAQLASAPFLLLSFAAVLCCVRQLRTGGPGPEDLVLASLFLQLGVSEVAHVHMVVMVTLLGRRFGSVNRLLGRPSPDLLFQRSLAGDSPWRNEVVKLMSAHLSLCEVVERVNSRLGLPVLLDVLASFVNILTLLYFGVPLGSGYLASSLVWSLAHFAKIAWLARACGSASREAGETSDVVRKLKLSAPSTAGPDALQSDVVATRVRFSACGFFDLDLCFLGSFATSVTTYLVILFQFSD